MSKQEAKTQGSVAWWREPMMWLVVGGPTLVVVASFVTLALALIYPDPVLSEKSPENRTGSMAAVKAMAPANEGRNHAATGGK